MVSGGIISRASDLLVRGCVMKYPCRPRRNESDVRKYSGTGGRKYTLEMLKCFMSKCSPFPSRPNWLDLHFAHWLSCAAAKENHH